MQEKLHPLDAPSAKRILVCVSGLSPQIVTETVFALCVQAEPKWIPDEIRLVTTLRGAENARLMLLSESPGWFQKLRDDWDLPHITFDESCIEVLKDAQGNWLSDIRDDDDNQSAADGIADAVRRATQDDHTEVHASIAGGRKTMGFFMGYAMSLWGKPQDKLSHVLVSSPFEARTEFFYPTPQPHIIPARNPGEDPLDASTAKVWLGNIPFVRLRSLLPDSLKVHGSGFAQAVAAANQAIDEVELEVDVTNSRVLLNQTPVHLPPMQVAFMCVLAWRCQQQLPALRAPFKDADDTDWKREVMDNLTHAIGTIHIPDSLNERLHNHSPIGDSFAEQLSKMERRLRASGALPIQKLIKRLNISSTHRQRGYSLNLQPQRVSIIKPSRQLANLPSLANYTTCTLGPATSAATNE